MLMLSRQTCKQCWGKVAPTHWIDECDRAEDLIQPLSIHAIQLLPAFSSTDLATLQAEDPDMADAYAVMHDGLHPSPDELRAFPLESRHLISQQPQIRLENDVMVKIDDDRTRLVVPTTLRYRLFEMAHAVPLPLTWDPIRLLPNSETIIFGSASTVMWPNGAAKVHSVPRVKGRHCALMGHLIRFPLALRWI